MTREREYKLYNYYMCFLKFNDKNIYEGISI